MLISDGSHETATHKKSNISLTDRLVWLLNTQYGGRGSVKTKYFHGAGGDAPVTRGVIQTNRQVVYMNGTYIVVNGHNHHSYYLPIVQESVSESGKVVYSTQHHVRTPGYKNE